LIKSGKLFKAFIEIIRRVKYENSIRYKNYIKYLKCKKGNKVFCCLNNCDGQLELLEAVRETEFKGKNNTIVLRRCSAESGMFSHLLVMMPYLLWAKVNNLNVYFDMERGDSTYREKKGENAWEYFYEQIGYKPERNNGTIISELFKLSDNYKVNFDTQYINEIIGLHSIYEMYIKLNDRMCSLIDDNWKKIYGGGYKILGVKFRGTDYAPNKIFNDHPFQATCDEMIERTRKFLEKYNYEYIYLCVEEQNSFDKFKKEFGEKVLSYDCKLIENYHGGVASFNQIALVGKRRAGEDYIGAVMCLARCDSILCSPNSGMYMTFVINGGKFEHVEIVDKGIYREGE